MKVVPSVIHKCLKFPHGNEVVTIHHSGFNPLSSKGNFSLESFCPTPIKPITPRKDFFYIAYQKFKAKNFIELSLHNTYSSTSTPLILDETVITPEHGIQETNTTSKKIPLDPSPPSFK